MNTAEQLADALLGNLKMLTSTLADFTDADMLVRPCPGANHAAWQLGHLINAEHHMVSAAKAGVLPELPAGFAERFSKQTANIDDPKALAGKDELLSIFTQARTATANWVRTLTPAELDQPMPEKIARFAPTVARLAIGLPVHVAMHVGQFQVIRRKLGKPLLF